MREGRSLVVFILFESANQSRAPRIASVSVKCVAARHIVNRPLPSCRAASASSCPFIRRDSQVSRFSDIFPPRPLDNSPRPEGRKGRVEGFQGRAGDIWSSFAFGRRAAIESIPRDLESSRIFPRNPRAGDTRNVSIARGKETSGASGASQNLLDRAVAPPCIAVLPPRRRVVG